jgi:cobalt-zinc-cadmium efflux system membrane fusion protein
MRLHGAKLLRAIALVAALVVLLGAAVWAAPHVNLAAVKDWWTRPPTEAPAADKPEGGAELVAGEPNTLRLPPDVVKAFGVRTAVARKAMQPRPLAPLDGWLALDSNHLVRIHSRFAGEVVQLGTVANGDAETGALGPTRFRPVRFGDRVEKGHLLAIVWSKDLGEKKSELVDAVSRLRLDQEQLDKLKDLYQRGGTAEANVRMAERTVESDKIALDKAIRTLRSWQLTEEEIEAIRAEADWLRTKPGKDNRKWDKDWARVEVRAPQDGTVLERNISVGDIIDTTTDLFKVADLDYLVVWANAYEEDLPALQALPRPIRWTVSLKADPKAPPLKGTVEQIGDIIDPAQHTALVLGRVDNRGRQMRAGQFIKAVIDLPPPPDEVDVPTTALVEDGRESIVFVQRDPTQSGYTLRRVAVARRQPDRVWLRDNLTPEEKKNGLQEVRPGETVVTAGAVELKAALEDLQAAKK